MLAMLLVSSRTLTAFHSDMKRRKPPKKDYSLDYRVKMKDGKWGDWKCAFGEWIGLQQVQNQINMLIRSHPRTIEIRFEMKGKLLDYEGNEIGRNLIFEKR